MHKFLQTLIFVSLFLAEGCVERKREISIVYPDNPIYVFDRKTKPIIIIQIADKRNDVAVLGDSKNFHFVLDQDIRNLITNKIKYEFGRAGIELGENLRDLEFRGELYNLKISCFRDDKLLCGETYGNFSLVTPGDYQSIWTRLVFGKYCEKEASGSIEEKSGLVLGSAVQDMISNVISSKDFQRAISLEVP